MGIFNRAKKIEKATVLKAFLDGKAIPIEAVDDGVFSEKLLGDGIAIIPQNEVVTAPADGDVIVLMEDSYHAVGLRLADGMELLIHIGLDTVAMEGDGFEPHVKVGSKVKTGDKLISFSRKKIAAAGYRDVTMMVITNGEDHQVKRFYTGENVKAGETVVADLTDFNS